MEIKERQLKDYKGATIYKSWVECCGTKCNVQYDAYINDEYFNSKNNLKDLKKSIDNYIG